jgi:tetrahydromethanopterin S-methyltransferase subunit G
MKFVKVLIISLFISLSCFAQSFENTAVPFTLADRDRIMRTEQKLEAFQKNVDEKFKGIDERFKGIDEKFASLRNEINTKFDAQQMQFEALQKQLDNIYTLMFFVLGAIMSLIGFVIYDRRTAIKPVQREQENIIRVLREYSAKHNDLSELLKNAGML